MIDIKNRGGLVTPSLAIDSVVNITERVLSQRLLKDSIIENHYFVKVFLKLSNKVMIHKFRQHEY